MWRDIDAACFTNPLLFIVGFQLFVVLLHDEVGLLSKGFDEGRLLAWRNVGFSLLWLLAHLQELFIIQNGNINTKYNIYEIVLQSIRLYIELQMLRLIIILIVCQISLTQTDPFQQLQASLKGLKEQRQLKGLQLQITKAGKIIYHLNLGEKNDAGQLINNNTVVRIASLSKSFATVALMQLVEKRKISLTDSLSSVLGYQIRNPYHPNISITLQMVLSHLSSFRDCDPAYIGFLYATRSAKNGSSVPNIRQLLHKEGLYYDECIFDERKPGEYFEYSNFNYGIIGTVVEKISGVRFDIYQRENILVFLRGNEAEIPTFAPWTLINHNNLATLYRGQDGQWVAQADQYPSGIIPTPNYTDYQVGTNGLLFSPQAGLRASVSHLNNYMFMLANEGITKDFDRVLSPASVRQMLKNRYQCRGYIAGDIYDFQYYGLGLYRTGYRTVDRIISHEVVYGHTGEDCGLLSGYHFWKDFTFAYYFTGSMDGYQNGTGTMYEGERMKVYSIIDRFQQKLAAM